MSCNTAEVVDFQAAKRTGNQPKPSRDHEEVTLESLRKDPIFTVQYLNLILEDGNREELMLALRRMSKALGGVSKVAYTFPPWSNGRAKAFSPFHTRGQILTII